MAEPHEYRQIIARAKKVWPCPPSVPAGWSCKWEDWKYLLTFYWLSPYYLMLPQIEMAVNIRHAIRGETRPLLFSNERQAFVFTLVDSPRKFFLFDGANGALYRFMSVGSEQALVHLMGQGDDAIQERLHLVKPSPEGEEAVQRILARDAAVIPLLTDKFLDYTPVATKPWEEGHLSEVDELPDEEELAAQIEKHEALVKALAAKKGVDISEQLLIDEYEEDEDEDDDDDDDDGIDGLEEELKKLLDMKVDLQKLVEEAEARGAH
ncbi:hypothetical protein DXG03_001757 [Asterophora parasitica]|uniref:Uncharacterized protein n=1 Tax=Asterophora parasitica TaxID=117018 RepID=A0A9P7KBF1_9AGAR|nr:hypothetical protein DXG03_001757 [Asterophora parasitica]